MVVPIVASMTGEEPPKVLVRVANEFGINSESGPVLLGLGLMFAALSLRSIASVVLSYLTARISNRISLRITVSLFGRYLAMPYEFHLCTHSAILVRNIEHYAAAVFGSGVRPLLGIISDSVLAIGLIGLMLLNQPVGTVGVVVVFALFTLLYLRLSRSLVNSLGEEKMKQTGLMMHGVLTALSATKELIVTNRQGTYVRRVKLTGEKLLRVRVLNQTTAMLPSAIFEIIAVGAIVLTAGSLIVAGVEGAQVLSTLALFGVSAVRLIPTFSRVSNAFQEFSFGRAAIEGAQVDLTAVESEQRPPDSHPLNTIEDIRVLNLTVNYETANQSVLNRVSLELFKGEMIGIVGASGAGKSTLVDSLLGLLEAKSGEILVNGRPLNTCIKSFRSLVGYVPQSVFLADESVAANVAFGIPEENIDLVAVRKALAEAKLLDFVDQLPQGVQTNVGERGVRLSGGERQRLGLARALYGNPSLVILDEATSALDMETEAQVMSEVVGMKGQRTLLVIAHRLSTVKQCDRLYRLEAGRIVQEGTFAEVIGSLPNA
jgi:ABC-type multidrug transport system fused ATPase/permease subunit